MAELHTELQTKLDELKAKSLAENKAYKKEIKMKFADLREAQVKEICEKVGEEHFQ